MRQYDEKKAEEAKKAEDAEKAAQAVAMPAQARRRQLRAADAACQPLRRLTA